MFSDLRFNDNNAVGSLTAPLPDGTKRTWLTDCLCGRHRNKHIKFIDTTPETVCVVALTLVYRASRCKADRDAVPNSFGDDPQPRRTALAEQFA